ncbi:MAG: diacylglycerol kinase family protein [Alteraurantiacibacter sp.]
MFERLPMVEAQRGTVRNSAMPPVRLKPLVGLIRNSRSHRNASAPDAQPVPNGVLAAYPRERGELAGILAKFAERQVDCIAIDGGDGTVRDVLTSGAGVFGDTWPAIIVLPSGKTNALAYDLGIPTGWTLERAIAALRDGHIARRRPLVVSQRDNGQAQARGFILGAGAFNRATALGQKSHDLGAFNAAVIGVTTVWSILQALFGTAGNAWRQGTRMRVRDASGAELPHRGGLPADERYFLLASTLRRFPAGIDLYGPVEHDLGLAMLDNPRRSLLLRLGALIRGTASEGTMQRGAHIVGSERFGLELEEEFILDGEAFPPGNYRIEPGARLRFVVP